MAVRSAFTGSPQADPPVIRTTLLELVALLSELMQSEDETLGMARALLASGRVQLTGSFRDCWQEVLSQRSS